MKFTLPCETYYRLSRVLTYFDPKVEKEIYDKLHCIRLENINGILIAIATNQKIAVIEKIGMTTQPNGVAHVIVDERLIQQCKTEKAFNSNLEIVLVSEIAAASAKTMFGYNYPGNACIFPVDTPMDDWREWASTDVIKKSKGAMIWDLDCMVMLNEASQSGGVTFPEFINAEKPVTLRDPENDNWVGLFLPSPNSGEPPVVPSTLPEWWK